MASTMLPLGALPHESRKRQRLESDLWSPSEEHIDPMHQHTSTSAFNQKSTGAWPNPNFQWFDDPTTSFESTNSIGLIPGEDQSANIKGAQTGALRNSSLRSQPKNRDGRSQRTGSIFQSNWVRDGQPTRQLFNPADGRPTSHNCSSKLKLACPFFKRNPKDPSCTRACAGPGWDLTRRVKEHVLRSHKSQISCPRCQTSFASQDDLEQHFQAAEPCERRDASQTYAIDKKKEDLLKSKKGLAGLQEADKWRKMYCIIFPDEEMHRVPSPYHMNTADLSGSVKELQARLLEVLPRRIKNGVAPSWTTFRDDVQRTLQSPDQFIRLEIMWRDFQAALDRVMREAVDSIINSDTLDDCLSYGNSTAVRNAIKESDKSGSLYAHDPVSAVENEESAASMNHYGELDQPDFTDIDFTGFTSPLFAPDHSDTLTSASCTPLLEQNEVHSCRQGAVHSCGQGTHTVADDHLPDLDKSGPEREERPPDLTPDRSSIQAAVVTVPEDDLMYIDPFLTITE